MCKKIWEAFNWFVERIIIKPLNKFLISVKLSQSRWGVFAFILGLGFFIFALAAEYSDSGGDVMVTALYVIGSLLMFVGLCLGVYFLRNKGEDEPILTEIKNKIDVLSNKIDTLTIAINTLSENINNLTISVNSLVQEIRQDRDERNNKV